ncbi:MAG: ABC transporter permease [Bacillota bacterium]|jgi:ribose transport system permease protein|nr:ABC transporter permease [Bacillota bacterium]NLJ03448.1 ABC transporter permease [Bacillota bacterium]
MSTELAKRRGSLMKSESKQKLLAFSSLLVMIIVFSIASPNFATFSNFVGILLSTAVVGILATGVTFIIITGGIDLSIGTVMTFCSVIAGVLITFWGLPIWVGVAGAILSGMMAGLINGLLISKMRLPAFIATLGMQMIAAGLNLVISGSRPIYFLHEPKFRLIAMGTLFGIPYSVFLFFGLAIIASIVLGRTVFGRYTYSIGSNEEATRLSGINVDRWKIAVYVLGGFFYGVAGVVMASRLNSAQPALGVGYELEAIAAVVIGGASLSGGSGTILGTIIGAFIMSVLTNGLRILSIPQEWQTVVIGSIVILAVYTDIIRRRKE